MKLSDRVYRLNLGVPKEFDDMSAYSAYLGNGVVDLEKRITELEAENERLRDGYTECVEDLIAWAAYASPYFQDKHDLEGTVAKHKKALAEGK